MSIMRKISCFIIVAMLFVMMLTSSNQIYAYTVYPLEDTEKVVEERLIDKDHIEIFTQLDDQFYLKKLKRDQDKWNIESTEVIHEKWTGFKINKTQYQGDRRLAKAIERELKDYGVEPAWLPPVVDYSTSEFLPPVGEQDGESCVGWSTGYYLRTFQQAKDIGWQVKEFGNGIDSHIFSPTFIYNQINNGVDKGAFVEDAGELLKYVGAATVESFSYFPYDFRIQPNQSVIQSAYTHRVREWGVLYASIDTDQYIIQKVKEYLNTGDLVVAGSRIGFKFYYPSIALNGKHIITTESYVPFGHAYVLVGYDDTFISSDGMGAFKLVNSWGKEWGDEGFCYISYKAFTANAMAGYVFTDLVNTTQEELDVDINDAVTFNINFSGTGRFDIKIKSENDELIYEESNLQGKTGLNTFTWNSKDMTGNIAQDGGYKLSIIAYKNGMPKDPFDLAFNKSSKVKSASSCAYIYENAIQYVDVPVTFKSDGVINLKVIYNNTEYDIMSNQSVKAGESKVYRIEKSQFNFSNKDLDQIKLKIDIH